MLYSLLFLKLHATSFDITIINNEYIVVVYRQMYKIYGYINII